MTSAEATSPRFSDGPAGDALLRVCAAPDADHGQAFATLDSKAWHWLVNMASTQRIAPLLHRSLQIAGSQALVPDDASAQLTASVRWHAIYTLKQGAAIADTLRLLGDEGFTPLVLKGAALAWRDYPDPVLRPLRDVDLLLTRDSAVASQALLLAHPSYRRAPWTVDYGPDHTHQLPEIQEIGRELTIEIHHRLNAKGWDQEQRLLALMAQSPDVIDLLGVSARVPSAHANVLHLVEHATLHHAFENGPLILSDLHYIAKRHSIDWERLQADAEAMGLANGLRLIARLAVRYGARWVPADFAFEAQGGDSHVMTARTVMLSEPEAVARHAMLRRLSRGPGHLQGWRGAFVRAFRPDRFQLAKISGFGPHNPLRWIGYPRWLANRGIRFFTAQRHDAPEGIVEKQLAMASWLSIPGSSGKETAHDHSQELSN